MTQQDEVPPGAYYPWWYASLGCAEGIEDLTSQEEHTQGSRCLEAGSAADEACSPAGGTGRRALGDKRLGLDVAVGDEVDGDGVR